MSSKSKKSYLIVFSLLVLIAALAIPVLAFATNAEEEHDGQEQTSEQNTPQEQNAEGDGLLAGIQDFINNILPNEDPNYMYFEPATPGQTCYFQLSKRDPEAPDVRILYSYDPSDSWTDYTLGTSVEFSAKVYLKGINNTTFSYGGLKSCLFKFPENSMVKAGGSIMSLLNGDGNETEIPSDYCFRSLFYEQQGLVSMPDLPATKLKNGCYALMFSGCTDLVNVSYISAKENLPSNCFECMFIGCTNLISTPEFEIVSFSSDEVSSSQCERMFESCIKLYNLNCKLNATQLSEGCYVRMFAGTLIEKAPYLPAKNLASRCYSHMFADCWKLDEVCIGFEDWDLEATVDWLNHVSFSGKLYAPDSLDVPEDRSSSTLPEGWTLLHEKPIIASVSGFTGTYDLQSHGVSVEATDPINPKVEYSYDGIEYQEDEISYSDVGSYIIYYKLSADGYIEKTGNVKVQIKPVTTATVSFNQATYTKDYGDADPNFDVNFNGLVVGDSPVKDVDYVITRQTGETASATGYEVKFHWLRDNNYIFPETKTTLTINKAKDFKLVADPASKSGRAADPTFTAHAEGLKFKDELKPADYEVKASETNNPTTKTLTPSLTASGLNKFSTNYDLSGTYVTTADFDIYFESGLKYKVNSFNGVYDAKDHVFSIDLVDTTLTDAQVLYSTDESHTTWKEDPPKFKNAGTFSVAFKITCPGYEDISDLSSLSITKKDMSIKASYKEIFNGEDKPPFDAEVSGMVEGESVPATDYTLSSVAGDTPAPGSYDIVVALAAERSSVLDNYNPSLINSKLFVKNYNKISYTSSGVFVVYDGNPHSINVQVQAPEAYKIEYKYDGGEYSEANPTFTDATATPQIVYYRITPTDPSYETIEAQESVNIEKRSATIIAEAGYKNEGEAEPELTAQVLGLVDGESLQPQVDYQLVRDEGEAPGVYEIHCNLLSNAVTDNYNIETTDSKFFVLGQGTPTPTPDPPSPEEINSNVAQTGDNLANTIATVIAVIAILGCLSYLVLQVRRKQ